MRPKLLPLDLDRATSAMQSAEVALDRIAVAVAKERRQLALLLDEAPPGPILPQAQCPMDGRPRPGWTRHTLSWSGVSMRKGRTWQSTLRWPDHKPTSGNAPH